ncbi:MAG: AAA family ATPase [Planctomycetota bacterium]
MNDQSPHSAAQFSGNATEFAFPPQSSEVPHQLDEFLPEQPKSLKHAGLHENDLYPLILKFLYLHGINHGHRIADQIKLPYNLVEPVLARMRNDMLVAHKAAAGVGDYQFELTPKGIEQAKHALGRSTYCGAAPVGLQEYKVAVLKQSVKSLRPTVQDVARAMGDLVVSALMINQLGQAITSGRSLFLFGAPGNGKTSIATRAIRSVNEIIWIPRSLTIGGEVIRLFDPSLHEAAPLPKTSGLMRDHNVDERWVRIKRPTIVVGGELTLKHLEATLNPVTGIIEAPIHVKSNCGCLVVDDFGRQQIGTSELLNRWIVPMESGNDFLVLPSGRQISLPFEQLLIFSTNLEPRNLCDEAFLRRIPYKVEVFDPTEQQYRALFDKLTRQMEFEVAPGTLDDLIEYHYKRAGRPFRFCHVADLLNQARDFCEFHRRKLMLNRDILELACLNYFSGMGHVANNSA